ncbi:matrix protein import protein [Schizosaccharomyces japonicus yFS275]|uniref:Phosphatidate cytidylyltransferase, mitochondrial n=1 Tax=Schizosaccharomyces japonicus (strain yFS275 / FY16936) TaxID=402676 RepID=B6K4K1_SCHJY|nr:matrix protein import protein [Schizosaccharomyces japonicus yFS275]EEB08408.1 matrix protein import protein [Schizosaccharomyces japonicus yFS275]
MSRTRVLRGFYSPFSRRRLTTISIGALLSPQTIQTPKTLQTVSIHPSVNEEFERIVNSFDAPIDVAIAYGSGVFSQKGYDKKKKPMLDFIFGVKDPYQWHSVNVKQNPKHYSFLKYFGSRSISYLQESVGTGVYYNPFVRMGGSVIKYGVTSLHNLYDDLLHWSTLYLAGRLHKPTKIIRAPDEFFEFNHKNLESALYAALPFLSEKFQEAELYSTIASLSYLGDVRMSAMAENPQKVKNIVAAQFPLFRKLYLPLIHQVGNIRADNAEQLNDLACADTSKQLQFRHDKNANACLSSIMKLPKQFQRQVLRQYSKSGDTAVVLKILAQESTAQRRNRCKRAVHKLTGFSILMQTIKGLLTAGFAKSFIYVLEKLKKGPLGKLLKK